eukprot:m51a1_g12015 putative rhodanese-like protein (129) ;mRNA; r:2582-3257
MNVVPGTSAVEYMLPDELASILNDRLRVRGLTVVDVRDEGGDGCERIAGAVHVPSEDFPSRVADLAHELARQDVVVFHCTFCKTRGPRCAAAFERALAGFTARPRVCVLEGGFRSFAVCHPELLERAK